MMDSMRRPFAWVHKFDGARDFPFMPLRKLLSCNRKRD
jgi:hypothetical protein